jgi:hypothetical protein
MLPNRKNGTMTKISNKSIARRNLLVSVVNGALERNLITFDSADETKEATFEYELAGVPIQGHIRDGGFGEVHLQVFAAPTDYGRKWPGSMVGYDWRRQAEAAVFGWFERQEGRYLQTSYNYHGTRETTAVLASIKVEPMGFGLGPPKYGYDFHREVAGVLGPLR